jgi:hypothetical protein
MAEINHPDFAKLFAPIAVRISRKIGELQGPHEKKRSGFPKPEVSMRYLKYFALLTILMVPFAYSQAQVRVGIGIGVGPGYVDGPPACAYGYYDYYPYACAPYGYYGPQYFVNGIFVGVGPWYHWGHPARFWNRGAYGRPGWGHGYYGHPRVEGRVYDRGYARGFARGEMRGGNAFHGGQSFHGGGEFHGGGRR